MNNQIATLPASLNSSNARNMDGDKERIATLTLVGVMFGRPQELAQARFWMSRSADGAGPVYCSIWLHGISCSGKGIARGYGYHKKSAALDAALESAGINLAQRIDGVGEGAMRDALIAVGVAMGHKAHTLAVLS